MRSVPTYRRNTSKLRKTLIVNSFQRSTAHMISCTAHMSRYLVGPLGLYTPYKPGVKLVGEYKFTSRRVICLLIYLKSALNGFHLQLSVPHRAGVAYL